MIPHPDVLWGKKSRYARGSQSGDNEGICTFRPSIGDMTNSCVRDCRIVLDVNDISAATSGAEGVFMREREACG